MSSNQDAEVDPVYERHVDVKQDHVDFMPGEVRERLSRVCAVGERITMGLKIETEELSVAEAVLD